MTYCAACGSPVEGRFCPKCGAAVGAPAGSGAGTAPPPPSGAQPGYVPPTPGQPGYNQPGYVPPPTAGLGMEENLASALCYIPIVGLIFLLIDPYKNNKTIRFHALQSIYYFIAWIVVSIALAIVFGILYTALPYGVYSIIHLVSLFVRLAFVIGWIWMAVKAYQRERFEMPVIGPMAARQA